VGCSQLPAEEQESGDPQDKEDDDQGDDIDAEIGVDHIQFFERHVGVLEVTVHLNNNRNVMKT